jgi:hypothetical protein
MSRLFILCGSIETKWACINAMQVSWGVTFEVRRLC